MDSTSQLKDKIEERNKALAAAREIIDRAAAENRKRTADENTTIRKAMTEFDRLNFDIQVEREARNRTPDPGSYTGLRTPIDNTETRDALDEKLRQWCANRTAPPITVDSTRAAKASRARHAGVEQRALSTGVTGNDAGWTIAESFAGEIYDYREKVSGFRDTMPRILTTGQGNPVPWPRSKAHGAAAAVDEAEEFAGTDPQFDEIVLNAHKFGQIITLSSEVLTDSGIDLSGFIAEDMGRSLARVSDNAYINGTGNNAPEGIAHATNGLAVGVTGATGNSGEPTFDELTDLKYSMDELYMPESCWLMRHETVGKIAKLKDDDGQYLWVPNRTVDTAEMLLGYPIKTSPHVAATGLNAKSVYFGNFREAVIIRDVGGIMMAHSTDYKFDTDQIAFRASMRTDSAVINGNAAKAFVGGAS